MSTLDAFYPKKPSYNGTIGETFWVLSANNLSSVINTNFIKTGLVYLQADYPQLFSIVGHTGGSPWTSYTISSFFQYTGPTYGNGLFVVGGADGGSNARVATSTNAATWTPGNSLGTTSVIYGVTFQNNLFFYHGSGGMLGTSTDAITWTARTSGTASEIRSVIHANGTYVYSGAGGAVGTSTDAITWTVRTTGTSSTINALAYGNGRFVGVGTVRSIYSTDNGVTWTISTVSGDWDPDLFNLISPSTSVCLIYKFGQFYSIFTPSSGSRFLFSSSSDGIIWYTKISNTNINGQKTTLNYINGLFLTDGEYSSDGRTWTTVSDLGTKVIYENGLYVAKSGSYGSYATNLRSSITSTLYNVNTEFLVPSITTNSTITTSGLLAGTGNLVCYVRAK